MFPSVRLFRLNNLPSTDFSCSLSLKSESVSNSRLRLPNHFSNNRSLIVFIFNLRPSSDVRPIHRISSYSSDFIHFIRWSDFCIVVNLCLSILLLCTTVVYWIGALWRCYFTHTHYSIKSERNIVDFLMASSIGICLSLRTKLT